jgi:hypothetical protein
MTERRLEKNKKIYKPERLERGSPLLTVKTEVNGDSKRRNDRGSFLGWFVGLIVPVQEIFVLHWLL